MTRAAFVALVALAALLPFELREPLLTVGLVRITSVELVLYAALALWAASGGLRRVGWTALHVAVAGWALAHLTSAALAEAERAASLKFALRTAGGCALAFVAADLLRDGRRAASLLGALVAGAVVSGVTAVAEVCSPGAAHFLGAFKTVTARSGDLLRAGGTFQYPNVAALYWSAALPLALVLGAGHDADGRRFSRWPAVGAALVLAWAVVVSASRGGIVVASLLLAALAIVRGRVRGLRLTALLALGGVAGAMALDAASRPGVTERWRPGLDAPWYRARFAASPPDLHVSTGETATVLVEARNVGALSWAASGPHPMGVAYEWRGRGGDLVEPGPALPLPGDVAPGETASLGVAVRAPMRPGRYSLRWQLVSDGAAWADPFDQRGADVAATVTGAGLAVESPPAAARPIQRQPTRLELWRAGLRMWRDHPFFGVGPDNFRRLYSGYLGARRLDERVAANSLYVETLADLGLLGAVALAALAAALGRTARHAVNGASPDGVALAAVVAVAAFFVHGLVDHVLPFTPTYGLFWILVGLVAARPGVSGACGS